MIIVSPFLGYEDFPPGTTPTADEDHGTGRDERAAPGEPLPSASSLGPAPPDAVGRSIRRKVGDVDDQGASAAEAGLRSTPALTSVLMSPQLRILSCKRDRGPRRNRWVSMYRPRDDAKTTARSRAPVQRRMADIASANRCWHQQACESSDPSPDSDERPRCASPGPSQKRRKGRGFQQETRQPFDDRFTLGNAEDSVVQRRRSRIDHCGSKEGEEIDEELEEILYRNDAELKPLKDESPFIEYKERSCSPQPKASDPWASLEHSRRRKLRNKERQQRPQIAGIGSFAWATSG